MKIHEMRKL